jgi:hypothetical protein
LDLVFEWDRRGPSGPSTEEITYIKLFNNASLLVTLG